MSPSDKLALNLYHYPNSLAQPRSMKEGVGGGQKVEQSG